MLFNNLGKLTPWIKSEVINLTGVTGGAVAQTVAPTTFGLDAHGGHRPDVISDVISPVH